jgi:hypothetical protein
MTLVTPQQTLVEIRLGEPLAKFIAKRRAAGKGWRPIAADISTRTAVKVSHETVRNWYLEFEAAEARTA